MVQFTGSMGALVNVSVYVQSLENERFRLVLDVVGSGITWSKVYDGSLFLSLDAQDLGLLEAIPFPEKGGPTYRLKQAAPVGMEALRRMRFVKTPDSGKVTGVYEP